MERVGNRLTELMTGKPVVTEIDGIENPGEQ